jgi:Hpt domain
MIPSHITTSHITTSHITTPVIAKVSSDLEPLIPRYLINRRKDVEIIGNMLSASDMEGLRTLGHMMKGSGASYGFLDVSTIGQRIEEAAKVENEASIRAASEELSQYLDVVQIVFVEEF